MTGAVKLNIGICSDDERAIRHDFMLNDKIVDLLTAGNPDFTIMDAIDVGVGNEAFPTPRRLGLILMGKNPLAVDLAGPGCWGIIVMTCPISGGRLNGVICPDILTTPSLWAIWPAWPIWTGLPEESNPMMTNSSGGRISTKNSPVWHLLSAFSGASPETGAKAAVLPAASWAQKCFSLFWSGLPGRRHSGRQTGGHGHWKNQRDNRCRRPRSVFDRSCAAADIVNARKITRIDNCFTTAVDMAQTIRGRLGMPAPILSPSELLPLIYNALIASLRKTISRRYLEDVGHFMKRDCKREFNILIILIIFFHLRLTELADSGLFFRDIRISRHLSGHARGRPVHILPHPSQEAL